MSKFENIEIIDSLIYGRVEPHIYAFVTNNVPNSLKVGDTYRPVSVRLNEWKENYPDLEKKYESSSKLDENTFFRDYSVHQYLTDVLNKERVLPTEFKEGVYQSKEFFKDTDENDVDKAVKDIRQSFNKKESIYSFYKDINLPLTPDYPRDKNWVPRPNQKEVINRYLNAVKQGRKNLLMYAVMRFGKSFTALCCAKENHDKFIVVVSAKADIKDEWRKNVQSPIIFSDFIFGDRYTLDTDESFVESKLNEGNTVVVFLTLQDLLDTGKERFRQIFGRKIDLLIIDETHFAARAEKMGRVLNDKEDKDTESVYFDDAETTISNVLDANIKLHLSGTPYRILMENEFEPEDLISFVQFSDIVNEQNKWNIEHPDEDESNNPYFGFPQMVRFAFLPNESSIQKLDYLKSIGESPTLHSLLEPLSIKKDDDNLYRKFKYESEVLDLFKTIDGSKDDENVFGFLNYKKIIEGHMCNHIAIVLPYCASCDALEQLLIKNRSVFNNLSKYEIINISGFDTQRKYSSVEKIKYNIQGYAEDGKKTITLTVNKMLTGTTVKEWDCMIFLKDTKSPQEYDQAIFRLQNQYIKTYKNDDGNVTKLNMKPQTILVDFEPYRMFELQEQKSRIYNYNTDNNGNQKLEKRIGDELKLSPIIVANRNKLHEVKPVDIMRVVSEYSKDRGIAEEVNDLSVDERLLDNETILNAILNENPLNSKNGINTNGYEDPKDGKGDELEGLNGGEQEEQQGENGNPDANDSNGEDTTDDRNKLILQFKAYYAKMLFFSFLTDKSIKSLDEIIEIIDLEDNVRISKNIGINKKVLSEIRDNINPIILSKLDYKIENINRLSKDIDNTPEERAVTAIKKFGKLGESIVMTPIDIANKMISNLPDDLFIDSVKNQIQFIDISSVSGEFAISLFNKFISLGFDISEFNKLIVSYTKNTLCYEFTRKVYKDLGLDINCINSEYSSYELAELDTDEAVELIKGGKQMKFEAVVGNPPYQENIENRGEQPPIYNKFYDLSFELSDIVTLITPARFIFDAGKTPKTWNQKMLNDEHFRVIEYFPGPRDVFKNVEIKGGVLISYRDANENFGAIKKYVPNKTLNSILNKVVSKMNESLMSIWHSNTSYRYSDLFYIENPDYINRVSGGSRRYLSSSVFSKFPEEFYEKKPNDGLKYAKIYGRIDSKRKALYFKEKYLIPPENYKKYKVIIASSNGSGALGETFSEIILGSKNEGSTETFLSFGSFDSKDEAENLIKYFKTRFLRIMLGTKKVTQGNKTVGLWCNVPLQDFTNSSDIDWSKTIDDIDNQLFDKYSLSKEERKYIIDTAQQMV